MPLPSATSSLARISWRSRAKQLAIQLDNYRRGGHPWSLDFDADTLARVDISIILTPALAVRPALSKLRVRSRPRKPRLSKLLRPTLIKSKRSSRPLKYVMTTFLHMRADHRGLVLPDMIHNKAWQRQRKVELLNRLSN